MRWEIYLKNNENLLVVHRFKWVLLNRAFTQDHPQQPKTPTSSHLLLSPPMTTHDDPRPSTTITLPTRTTTTYVKPQF